MKSHHINHESINKRFKRSFKWTLAGSIIYETIKATHCFLLMQIMPHHLYGAMGSIFALIYLVTYIADLGATNSLPPFFNITNQSKENFKLFITKYSLYPHLPLIIICSLAATYVAATNLPQTPALIIIPALISLETTRSFLRMLLHTTFQAKATVAIELIIFFLYLASIWGCHLILNIPISLNLIFATHLIDSIICVTLFIILTIKYLKSLPSANPNLPQNFVKRLAITRIFNYLLRVSRNMFTSNFLTPLFAIKFGLSAAGIFYFASIIANTTQAIVKSAIGYSGNALLANLKESPHKIKIEAFNVLCNRLIKIIIPIIVILTVNHQYILTLANSHTITGEAISYAAIFITISFSEFFFILYEQFYIIEEAARKLFFLKILELTIFYGLLASPLITSPFSTLVGILFIRSLSFIFIALNAYYNWRIKPKISNNLTYIFICIVIAVAARAALFSFLGNN